MTISLINLLHIYVWIQLVIYDKRWMSARGETSGSWNSIWIMDEENTGLFCTSLIHQTNTHTHSSSSQSKLYCVNTIIQVRLHTVQTHTCQHLTTFWFKRPSSTSSCPLRRRTHMSSGLALSSRSGLWGRGLIWAPFSTNSCHIMFSLFWSGDNRSRLDYDPTPLWYW